MNFQKNYIFISKPDRTYNNVHNNNETTESVSNNALLGISSHHIEYDEPQNNILATRDDNSVRFLMDKDVCNQFETQQNCVKVIFEFPQKTNDEWIIHTEVKQMMENILQEQLTKKS